MSYAELTADLLLNAQPLERGLVKADADMRTFVSKDYAARLNLNISSVTEGVRETNKLLGSIGVTPAVIEFQTRGAQQAAQAMGNQVTIVKNVVNNISKIGDEAVDAAKKTGLLEEQLRKTQDLLKGIGLEAIMPDIQGKFSPSQGLSFTKELSNAAAKLKQTREEADKFGISWGRVESQGVKVLAGMEAETQRLEAEITKASALADAEIEKNANIMQTVVTRAYAKVLEQQELEATQTQRQVALEAESAEAAQKRTVAILLFAKQRMAAEEAESVRFDALIKDNTLAQAEFNRVQAQSIALIDQATMAQLKANVATEKGAIEAAEEAAARKEVVTGALGGIAGFAGFMAIQQIGSAIKGAFDEGLDYTKELQTNLVGLTKVLNGNEAAAKKVQQQIYEVSKDTAQNFKDILAPAQTLFASGVAKDGDQLVRELRAIADIATVMRPANIQEAFNGIAISLQKMHNEATVSGRDIQRLNSQGVNAVQMLADAFHVSTADMTKDIKAGLVPTAQAIPALFEEMEKRWGGAAKKASMAGKGLDADFADVRRNMEAKAFKPIYDDIQRLEREFVRWGNSRDAENWADRTASAIRDEITPIRDLITSLDDLKSSLSGTFGIDLGNSAVAQWVKAFPKSIAIMLNPATYVEGVANLAQALNSVIPKPMGPGQASLYFNHNGVDDAKDAMFGTPASRAKDVMYNSLPNQYHLLSPQGKNKDGSNLRLAPTDDVGRAIAQYAMQEQGRGLASSFVHECEGLAHKTVSHVSAEYDRILTSGGKDNTAAMTMHRFMRAGIGYNFTPGMAVPPGSLLYSETLGHGSGHVQTVGPEGQRLDQYGTNKFSPKNFQYVVPPPGVSAPYRTPAEQEKDAARALKQHEATERKHEAAIKRANALELRAVESVNAAFEHGAKSIGKTLNGYEKIEQTINKAWAAQKKANEELKLRQSIIRDAIGEQLQLDALEAKLMQQGGRTPKETEQYLSSYKDRLNNISGYEGRGFDHRTSVNLADTVMRGHEQHDNNQALMQGVREYKNLIKDLSGDLERATDSNSKFWNSVSKSMPLIKATPGLNSWAQQVKSGRYAKDTDSVGGFSLSDFNDAKTVAKQAKDFATALEKTRKADADAEMALGKAMLDYSNKQAAHQAEFASAMQDVQDRIAILTAPQKGKAGQLNRLDVENDIRWRHAGSSDQERAQLKQAEDAARQMADIQNQAQQTADTIEGIFRNSLEGGLRGIFGRIEDSFVKMLENMAVEYASSQLAQLVTGTAPSNASQAQSNFGAFGGLLGGLFHHGGSAIAPGPISPVAGGVAGDASAGASAIGGLGGLGGIIGGFIGGGSDGINPGYTPGIADTIGGGSVDATSGGTADSRAVVHHHYGDVVVHVANPNASPKEIAAEVTKAMGGKRPQSAQRTSIRDAQRALLPR